MSSEVVKTENTKETAEVIILLNSVAGIIKEAKADGKVDIYDAIRALKITPEAYASFKDIQKVPEELVKMSGEEKDAIIMAFIEAGKNIAEAVAL